MSRLRIPQDLRLAARALRATPLVTAVVIGSLALAIGANTAVFSLVNSLLLRALPVREPDRLVHVTDSVLNDGGVTRVRAWSYPQWDQIHRKPQLFESTAAWSFVQFNRASGGEAQFVEGMWASGSYFDTLGVRAVLGRTFSPPDDQPRRDEPLDERQDTGRRPVGIDHHERRGRNLREFHGMPSRGRHVPSFFIDS